MLNMAACFVDDKHITRTTYRWKWNDCDDEQT